MALLARWPLGAAGSVGKVPGARYGPRGSAFYWAVCAASVVIVLGGWEFLGARINPVFLSTPWRIVVALLALVRNGQLFEALQLSLLGIVLGFGAAIVVGVPLGILMGRSRTAEAALEPWVNALYVTPRVALIPLLLIWFGIGFEAQVVVIFLSSVFPLIVNSYAGVREVSSSLVDTARSFCANERQLFYEVVLPASVPFIMTGLRLGIGQAAWVEHSNVTIRTSFRVVCSNASASLGH